MRLHLIFLFVLIALCLSSASPAEEADSTVIYNADPIVVTGTRLAQQKSSLPLALSVVNKNDLGNLGEENVLPALQRHVPGLIVGSHGAAGYGVGPASGGTVSIRGMSGAPNTRVLVLIDGQPQFMGIFGHPISDSYMAGDADRVEVLRGPASVLYGSNALGGALNIVTASPPEGLSATAEASFGSFNTRRVRMNAGYGSNDRFIYVSAARIASDGHRDNADDAFASKTVFMKSGFDFSEMWALRLDGRLLDARYNHPGPVSMPLTDDRRDYLRGRAALSLENHTESLKGAFKVFYNWGNHDFSDGFNSNDFTRGITFYQNWTGWRGAIVTIGLDYKNYGGEPDNGDLPPALKENFGLAKSYSVDEWELYGLLQKSMGAFTAQAGYRLQDNSVYGQQHVPAAGLSFKADGQTTIRVAASRGFRSPTINDLYLFPPSNAALQPEELWNYEAGINRSFFQRHLVLDLTAYLIDAENFVQEVPQNMGPPLRKNSGAVTNRGVELAARLYASRSLSFYGNYSYLDSDAALLYNARHTLNGGLRWQYQDIRLSANLGHVADLVNRESPLSRVSYTVVDLGAEIELLQNVDVFGRLENLLDEKYEMDAGYPMPGRFFNVGARYRW